MSVRLDPFNPLRPPNWQWQRATQLIREGRRIPRRNADADLVRMVHFLRQRSGRYSRWSNSESEQIKRDRHLYRAFELYESTDAKYMITRDEIEARILANESPGDIAARIGYEIPVIDTFELMFFDVRTRLSRPSYILHHVIGPEVHRQLSSRDYRTIWKLFGYHSGPQVLTMLVDTFVGRLRPANSDELPAYVKETGTNDFMRQVLLTAKTFNVNAFSQGEVMDFFAKMTQIEKMSDAGGQPGRDSLLKNIDGVLEALAPSWRIGEVSMDESVHLQYDKQAVEPSSKELLAIAAGETPSEFIALAGSLTYPPRTSSSTTEG
jgi:hypothetical protein